MIAAKTDQEGNLGAASTTTVRASSVDQNRAGCKWYRSVAMLASLSAADGFVDDLARDDG
jgi:hypothetical protein